MSLVAPTGRQHLSADALFDLGRNGCADIPAYCPNDTDMSFTDALMSAWAMFALTSPSLRAFDKERSAGNLHPISGMQRVPCDTHRRERLDPVSPEALRPVCQSVFRPWQRGQALEPLVFLEDSSLLALDGTGYFASQSIPCASCLRQVPRNGSVTSYQQMLGAALLHPDGRAVMPLMPEPIVTHDGTDKNDGERHAAKRLVAKLRQDHPHRKCIITDASLRAHAPHIATLHTHDLHSLLGGKAGDHAVLFQQVQAAEHAGRVTSYARHDRAAGVVHRCRCVHDMPRHASNADVRVHCIEYWEMGQAKGQHCSWGTDVRVTARNVSHLMRGGRARWKMDNETCNTLKQHGDHFEHHDGPGTQKLSVVFAMVLLLALLVDQTQQLCWALCRAVWVTLGSKRLLWERLRSLFSAYRLESMRALWEALWYGIEKHRPILTMDTS